VSRIPPKKLQPSKCPRLVLLLGTLVVEVDCVLLGEGVVVVVVVVVGAVV